MRTSIISLQNASASILSAQGFNRPSVAGFGMRYSGGNKWSSTCIDIDNERNTKFEGYPHTDSPSLTAK
jgi:hypothetical protein